MNSFKDFYEVKDAMEVLSKELKRMTYQKEIENRINLLKLGLEHYLVDKPTAKKQLNDIWNHCSVKEEL